MGTYIYTLRSATKHLGGHEIGQFKFAFKAFWGAEDDKVCASQLAAGQRAAEKLSGMGCQLFVKGSWGEDQEVHWNWQAFGSLTEEFVSCPHVGWLRKDSRGRWYLHLKTEAELLAEHPEIGTLQTDEGRKFYFTDRNKDGSENRMQYPPNANLYQVVANVQRMKRRINGY